MGIRFIRFRAAHLEMFAWQGPQLAEREKLLNPAYAWKLEAKGIGWTGVDDEGIVGCAGFLPEGFGLSCWAAFSDRLPRHAKSVVRFVREKLNNRSEAHIYALVQDDNPKAAPFAGVLGFKPMQPLDGGMIYKLRR